MKKLMITIALIGSWMLGMAEVNPQFPGGENALKKYLDENTRYPEIAKENGVEGIVMVGFMVMPDGSLQNLKVEKFVDPDLEKEALRVVGAMPAWIPAEEGGNPIEAPGKVSIPFILE